MNSVLACFFIGLVVGVMVTGIGVYQWEEGKILNMKNAEQAALIDAQNRVLSKEHEGQTITQKVSQAYEKKIADIKRNAAVKRLQNPTNPNGMPQVSLTPSGSDGATCEDIAIRLLFLQEWVTEEIAAFNK